MGISLMLHAQPRMVSRPSHGCNTRPTGCQLTLGNAKTVSQASEALPGNHVSLAQPPVFFISGTRSRETETRILHSILILLGCLVYQTAATCWGNLTNTQKDNYTCQKYPEVMWVLMHESDVRVKNIAFEKDEIREIEDAYQTQVAETIFESVEFNFLNGEGARSRNRESKTLVPQQFDFVTMTRTVKNRNRKRFVRWEKNDNSVWVLSENESGQTPWSRDQVLEDNKKDDDHNAIKKRITARSIGHIRGQNPCSPKNSRKEKKAAQERQYSSPTFNSLCGAHRIPDDVYDRRRLHARRLEAAENA